jgi:hypothetical protein
VITIAAVTVASYSPDFLDVTWDIDPTQEDPNLYTFEVQRSESPAGPFERIAPARPNVFTFRDHTVELRAKWRIYYYQVLVTEIATGGQFLSRVGYFGLKPSPVSLEIARLQQLQLKVQNGTPCLIFKRRTSGPPCLECYDSDLERKTRSQCTLCLGEQFRGGFLAAIPTFINTTPVDKTRQPSPIYQSEAAQTNFDMAGYPIVAPGDVVVDPINQRWRVEMVKPRAHQGFIYRQLLTVIQIPVVDVIHRLFVDPQLFPSREGPLWPRRAFFGRLAITQELEEGLQ